MQCVICKNYRMDCRKYKYDNELDKSIYPVCKECEGGFKHKFPWMIKVK